MNCMSSIYSDCELKTDPVRSKLEEDSSLSRVVGTYGKSTSASEIGD